MYVCIDQSPSTPHQRGFFGVESQGGSPPSTELGFPGAAPDYQAMGVRANFSAGNSSACTADADTLCLLGGRFEVEIDWQSPTTSGVGMSRTIPGVDFSGLFWFFNPNNLEMLVKVIDGCALNNAIGCSSPRPPTSASSRASPTPSSAPLAATATLSVPLPSRFKTSSRSPARRATEQQASRGRTTT